ASQDERGASRSYANRAEAQLVSVLVDHIAAAAEPWLSIGVIAPYAGQVTLLRRLMAGRPWAQQRELEIDTVDAFEGREKDVSALSFVRSNRRHETGFLQLEQRLNVAISRARRLLVMVGDTATLRDGAFARLLPTVAAVGQVRPAPAVLE